MEEALSKALAFEKKYDWLQARDVYEHALATVDEKDFQKRGELQERIGLCLHRAAFQAESQEEFRERTRTAVEAYEKAGALYERSASRENEGRKSRCRAVSKYLQYWLVREPSEKKRLLDESLELGRKALTTFSDVGSALEFVRTNNELSGVGGERGSIEWDRSLQKKLVEEGMAWGEEAVRKVSELDDPYEAARANFVMASCILASGGFIAEPEKKEEALSRALEYSHRASEFSERLGDAYLLRIVHSWSAGLTGGEERMSHRFKALECAEETHDTFIKASVLDGIALDTFWNGFAEEDPDRKKKLYEQAMEFYDKAQLLYSVFSYVNPRGGVIAPPDGHAEHDFYMALLETDREKRMKLLERSEKAELKALKVAEELELPGAIWTANHVLSKTLAEQAILVQETGAKKSLLEKALEFRKKSIEQQEQLAPYSYHNVGLFQCYSAVTKAQLAEIEPDDDSKRRLFEEAVQWMEKGLDDMRKALWMEEKTGGIRTHTTVLRYQYGCGVLLNQLYGLTGDQRHLRGAIETWGRAIETAKELDGSVSIAESYWRVAQAHDTLREPSESAQSFRNASESYVRAAEKIPQLKDLYVDHANYMQAWSEIQEARRSHNQKSYEEAVEHFDKAAQTLKGTTRWNQFATNYLAWARLEEGEALSRKEKTEEARDAFQKAAELFTDAKHDIARKLASIPAGEERENFEGLLKASDQRREYCLSRAVLEDARVSAGQGASAISAEKYGTAAGRLERLMEEMQNESDRRELRPIANLCRAWERMMQAEQRLSPGFYSEASGLFEQAVEHSLDQQTSLLAQANSYMCKALEAGMRFEATKTSDLFSAAKKYLDAATTQYLRAGYRNASEYSRATSRLLDAYSYMYQAQVETDPVKRVQSYQMAETMLQTSAGSYVKARLPAKAEEVQRVLEVVREDREIAVSLSGVLKAPTIASTTTGFLAPTQSHEQAVGLERFENADILASLMPHEQEAKLGDLIRLKLDLVNAGKGGAQLIKLAELVPENFELIEKPEMYNTEDRGLNMKGKNLGPLRTDEVSLVLKPLDKGTYQIKPRILYLDESGKYKSHEPEPATIVVKELGISGWLKGPTRDK